MRTFLLLIAFATIAPAQAADPWSDADKTREAAYLTLHAADWMQTRYGAKHPDRYTELNSFLGEHPTPQRVNGYFLSVAALHFGVAYVLPRAYRAPFQYVTIGLAAGAVARNLSIGCRFDF